MSPQVIILAIQAAMELISWARKAAEEGKRTKEWTPEEEAAIDAKIEAIGTKPSDIDTGK